MVNGRNRPILLKKSAMVCASEKYASEIEIFTFGRGFRTRISRSSVQKRCFRQSMIRQFGQTDFFNRIGQWRTFDQMPLTSCVQLPTLLKSSIKPVLLWAKGRHCGEYQQDKTVEKS